MPDDRTESTSAFVGTGSEKARRAQRGKSRSGCQECKRRRKKCDEGLPECDNCKRRGIRCSGYSHNLRWSTKHEKVKPKATPTGQCALTSDSIDHIHDTCDVGHDSEPVVDVVTSTRPPAEYTNTGELHPDSLNALEFENTHGLIDVSADEFVDVSALTELATYCDHDINTQADSSTVAQSQDLLVYNVPVFNHGTIPVAGNHEQGTLAYRIYPTTQQPKCSIFHSLVDLPTALIEYWFAQICPVWSSFDSECNYNRQLASSTWSRSEAVFYTLQRMSAAYLVPSMPQLRRLLPSLTEQVTSIILRSLPHTMVSPSQSVKSDIIFAVFGLGTSLHWTDTPIQTDWLEKTRNLLEFWKATLSPPQAFVHAYFEQALIYWRMLMCATTDFNHENLERRRVAHRKKYVQVPQIHDEVITEQLAYLDTSSLFGGTRPNSWCGVSSEVVDVFGQVLALCRATCQRHKASPDLDLATTMNTLCDVQIAHELQNELLTMDFDHMVLVDQISGFPVETGDDNTPLVHLVYTADAYRKAALLQLYLTFDELDVSTCPDLYDCVPDNGTQRLLNRQQKLLSLTLEIVRTLELIPADSGSKSIHPILYLAAASGLRYEADSWHPLTFDQHNTLCCINQASLEVAKARNFVRNRVKALQHTLPSRPLEIMEALTCKIWAAYDNENDNASNTHWMGIMVDSRLHTLFG